jgi:hypothetical protein
MFDGAVASLPFSSFVCAFPTSNYDSINSNLLAFQLR